jgi:hypothetical protein
MDIAGIHFTVNYYAIIGKIAIVLLVCVFLFNVLAVALGIYCLRKKKIIFPKFILFMLYLFYSPTKWVFSVFSMNELMVDEILIEIQNATSLEKFKKQKERRIVLLPQCLRSSTCNARCDPFYGFICTKCGHCDISSIMVEAQKRRFKVFIIPGSSFVKKIFKEYQPTSCIGIACPIELSESMQKTSSVVPSQGVFLTKDGCFETKVNVNDIIAKMDLVAPLAAEDTDDSGGAY